MTKPFSVRWLAYFAMIEAEIAASTNDEFRRNLIESLAAEKHRARTEKHARAPRSRDLRGISIDGTLCR